MNIKVVFIAGLAGASFLSGCATRQTTPAWPEARPLGQEFETFRPAGDPDSASMPSAAVEEPTGVLTLRDALSLALLHNPELAGVSWEIRAKDAEALQAGLLPNPEVGVDVEEFAGSGDRNGFDSVEATIQLSQLIELGDKRAKRERVAGLDRDLAGWDYEAKRLDVLTEVARAFYGVLGAQEGLALAEERVELSKDVLKTISVRVAAGKVSPIEETKARVTLATSRIERDLARRDLEIARSRLAATWGGGSPAFEKAGGRLGGVSPVPSIEQVAAAVSQNPDVARWAVETARRRAAVDLEEANRIPDLTLSAGPQWFGEGDDAALAVGVSIPIPFTNRNQGARRAARFNLLKAMEERRAAELRVNAALAETHETLETSFAEVEALNREVLPEAQKALDAVSEGYQQGKLDYLDVLDSQRTFFEAKALQIQALVTYHKAAADLERLIGTPLAAVGDGATSEQEELK